MKIGNEIDHLGLIELEADYRNETTLQSWIRSIIEAVLTLVCLIVWLIVVLLISSSVAYG